MTSGDEHVDQLAELFRNHLNVDVADSETDLLDTGLLDSLVLVELLMHLENDYQVTVEIQDLEFENFRTIRSIAQFIARHQGAS